MNNLPSIVPRQYLSYWWSYKNEEGKPIALVARYDAPNSKKKFHQFKLTDNEKWIEGAPTPLPLYGLESLSKAHYEETVYIFEGEKCTKAAYYIELSALTSMMGSSQGQYADWSILAKYRHIKTFVLIPDNDSSSHKYMKTVFAEIQKACPNAHIFVCQLPVINKGDDLVDWIKSQPSCPLNWNGLDPIDEPHNHYLKIAFEENIKQNSIEAAKYFEEQVNEAPIFECDPEPIEEVLSKTLPCPTKTLPIEVVKWIQGFALQMQISEDYLSASLLVYLGSLIGRKRGLRLRQGTNWIEYPNVWGMLIGRPSMMKSPAMNAVRGPLLKLAERASKKYMLDLEQYEVGLESWKIRKKAHEEMYKKNYKKSAEIPVNKSSTGLQYQVEDSPKTPKKRRYKTEDSTIEKLGELLIENPQGLLLFRDELVGWLNSFDKMGRENDRQFYLESWGGCQDFDVDRISRGSLHIPALCLSILGSIQPGPLSQYVRSAVNGGVGDDGFIQRFQIMVWPDAKTDWELIQGISIPELEKPIHQIFDCLDKLSFDSNEEPVILTFTNDTQELFDQWQKNFEKRLRSGSLAPHLEAHLTKYKKLLPALCLIFEHLKLAIQGTYPTTITAQTLKDAINWLSYFESHACRVYGSSANAIPKTARELVERIYKGEVKEPFTARDIYHGKHWSGLANAEQVEEVLEYLEEKHYIASKQLKTSGRPQRKYWVNPKVFEETNNTEGPFEPFEPVDS